jgi:hypothetical protein
MDTTHRSCPNCGGRMIPGNIVLPILGTPKFAHRVKGLSVETELDGLMCESCGEVTLRARDPERIKKIYDATMRLRE